MFKEIANNYQEEEFLSYEKFSCYLYGKTTKTVLSCITRVACLKR